MKNILKANVISMSASKLIRGRLGKIYLDMSFSNEYTRSIIFTNDIKFFSESSYFMISESWSDPTVCSNWS